MEVEIQLLGSISEKLVILILNISFGSEIDKHEYIFISLLAT